jgi:hypothetical protein
MLCGILAAPVGSGLAFVTLQQEPVNIRVCIRETGECFR